MKLEPVHKSIYAHNSLGENIFHFHLMGQIKKQMNNNVFNSHYVHAASSLYDKIRSARVRVPVLEYLEYYGRSRV
jgi:hypothetical protein